jgi:hypothetical protein
LAGALAVAGFLIFVRFVIFVLLIFGLAGEAGDFHLGVMTEVDDEAEAMARGFEVIENLSLMLRCDGFDGFDGFEFEDDLAVTNDVRLVCLLERLAFVGELEFLLGDERNPTQTKFLF